MFRTAGICCDERQVDIGCLSSGKFDLCLLSSFFNPLHSHRVTRKVDTLLFFKFFKNPIHDLFIEIISTEMCITICREHFYHTFCYFQNRNIKSSATQVVNSYFFFFFIFHSISQSCCCRFIYDSFNFQAGNFACIFCSLTLSIVEICWYSDNSFCYLLTKMSFSSFFHFV